MHSRYFLGLGPSGFHQVHYTEWGDQKNPRVLVCVHGLTRNCRDFDFLAAALEKDYRVICPDIPGRGRSEWLANTEDYNLAVYLTDMAILFAQLQAESIDWLGTSMGGIIGMLIAAQPNNPIRRMLINDIGPSVSKVSLDRIARYVGTDPQFPDLQQFEQYLRNVHAPFGPLTDSQWSHLASHSAKPGSDSGYSMHYDPGIAERYKNERLTTMNLWDLWDNIKCPVLTFRGKDSDLLSADTAAEMSSRGPKSTTLEFSGIGHAPALMSEDQIDAVRNWFNK